MCSFVCIPTILCCRSPPVIQIVAMEKFFVSKSIHLCRQFAHSKLYLPQILSVRSYCESAGVSDKPQIELLNKHYKTDKTCNITSSIKSKLAQNLHNRKHHPINLVRQRIQDFFYRNYVGRTGNALYAVFDNLSPVVSMAQNFDSLLVPTDHPSRHPKV